MSADLVQAFLVADKPSHLCVSRIFSSKIKKPPIELENLAGEPGFPAEALFSMISMSGKISNAKCVTHLCTILEIKATDDF